MMRSGPLVCFALLVACVATCTGHASGAVVTFTSRTDFDSAISGLATQTLDFEGLAAGTLLPSPSTVEGITFTYNIAGIDMKVTDLFLTTSGDNYLGLDDEWNWDQFMDGDEFDMSLASPVNAIGMYFVTSDPLWIGDIELVTPVGTAVNSDIEETVLSDGGMVYFLGLADMANMFSSASIQHDADPSVYFFYNVDDIVTAVIPEPASILVWGGLFAGILFWKRRRHMTSRN